MGGRVHGGVCGADCGGAERHQAHSGLFDCFAVGLHDAGLGMGGVAVGMFHLITHAFFKALLFMGAGSVIHGCHEEQDIRKMGGLKADMPVTFITYAAGMLALCGFPAAVLGLLEQRRHSGSGAALERGQDAVLHAGVWRFADGFLHDAAGGVCLLWCLAREEIGAREPRGDDAAASHSGLLRGGAGIHWNACMAVVQGVSGRPSGKLRSKGPARTWFDGVDGHVRGGGFAGIVVGAGGSTVESRRSPRNRTHWRSPRPWFGDGCATGSMWTSCTERR